MIQTWATFLLALVVLSQLEPIQSTRSPAGLGWMDKPWDYEIMHFPLRVQGTPPKFLNGTFYRHSCGQEIGHWFVGLGLFNTFVFHEGVATFNTRFIQSHLYCFHRPKDVNGLKCEPTGVATAVVVQRSPDNKILSTTDSSCWDRVNTSTLSFDFLHWQKDSVGCNWPPHEAASPAHVQRDPFTNSLLSINQKVHPTTKRFLGYQIFEVSPASPDVRTVVGKIPPHPVFNGAALYIHSFGLTTNYLILGEAPWRNGYLNPNCGKHQDPFECYNWLDNTPGMFRIVSRKTWEVIQTIEVPYTWSCYFHTAGAYEWTDIFTNQTSIILDAAAFPYKNCSQVIHGLYPNKLINGDKTYLTAQVTSSIIRWQLPLPSSRNNVSTGVSENRSSEQVVKVDAPVAFGPGRVEMPCWNQDYNTVKYRYVYACQLHDADSAMWDQIVKHDWTADNPQHWHEPFTYVMEPVFVPAYNTKTTQQEEENALTKAVRTLHNGTTTSFAQTVMHEHQEQGFAVGMQEDNGLILSLALHSATNTSFILVLDARDMAEVARYWLPTGFWVPFGFHGLWVGAGL